jgi:hypothetical protein
MLRTVSAGNLGARADFYAAREANARQEDESGRLGAFVRLSDESALAECYGICEASVGSPSAFPPKIKSDHAGRL